MNAGREGEPKASSRIGFVGGGQLAMMTAQEALRMREDSTGRIDLTLNILDPSPKCPADRYAARHIVAGFRDASAVERLAGISDILTYEIELGNANALGALRARGVRVLPSPETLGTIQDKYAQKEFLRSRGIPVPRYAKVESLEDLNNGLRDFGLPAMLKARRDSYDGRGNYMIRRREEAPEAYRFFFAGRALLLEEFVPWDREVSVMAVRGMSGEVETFPVGENAHQGSILRMTVMPARIPRETAGDAENLALRVVEAFADHGVFGVEMFERDGRVVVNEVAPRVHNTGHGTLERDAFEASQFEQHLRAITGLPLRNTAIKRPVVMHNILGQEDGYVGAYSVEGVEQAERIPGVHVHMYGKEEVRPRRKMGHLSVVGEELIRYEEKGLYDERAMQGLIARAVQARELIKLVGVSQNA